MWRGLGRQVGAIGCLLLAVVGSEAVGQATIPESQMIPVKTNFAALAAWQIENGGLSTEVRQGEVAAATKTQEGEGDRVKLSVAGSSATSEGFINYVKPCYDNFELHYLFTVATDGQPISGVTLTVEYSESMSNPRSRLAGSERNADEHDAEKRRLTWREQGLPSNSLWTQSLIFEVEDPRAAAITVTLTYNGGKTIVTSYVLPSCYGPNKRTSDKLPAVLCHPAEEGCTQFLPNLGIQFNQADAPQECSGNDESCRGLRSLVGIGGAEAFPRLGIRFRDAYPDLVPGDCRVLEDNAIAGAALHDTLLRDGDKSSPLIRPLYESGQEFRKSIVIGNGIDGVKFFKEGRRKLREIHDKAWGAQLAVVKTALEGGGNPGSAAAELDSILSSYREELKGELANQADEYAGIQEDRKGRYEPLIEPAVEKAKNLIQTACNLPEANDDADLELFLRGPVQRAYERMLDFRRGNFEALEQQLSPLPVITALWQGEVTSAIQEFYGGNQQPLQDYAQGAGVRSHQAFEEEFAVYLDWWAGDDRLVNEAWNGNTRYLLNLLTLPPPEIVTWEVALDFPKQKAMSCFLELQNILPPAVEITACEAGPAPPEEIIQGAPFPVKANNILTIGGFGSDIAPPDTDALDAAAPQTTIDPGGVTGVPCRSLPGDPYWSADCSCNCGGIRGIPGGVGSCPVSLITRHDRYVTTVEECLNEPDDHFDPLG